MDESFQAWGAVEFLIWQKLDVTVKPDRAAFERRTRQAWATLSDAQKEQLVTASNTLIEAQKKEQGDRDKVAASKKYRAASDDEGKMSDPARPPFATYAANVRARLASLQEYMNAIDEFARIQPAGRSLGFFSQVRGIIPGQIAEQQTLVNDLPRLGEMAERRRTALGLLGDDWVGSWKVGSGGCGVASLWVKQNPQNVVCDRLVIKECAFRPNQKENWVNGQVGTVPCEVQALYNLRGKEGSSTIIKIRNWRLGDLSYRLYLEYGQTKDLWKLLEVYWNIWFPTDFLWHVLQRLSIAGILMERGELEKFNINPWCMIIHRDLKPANVFLGGKCSDSPQGYPEMKLGDFGFAFMLAPNEQATTTFYEKGKGTLGYLTPEQDGMLRNEFGNTINVMNSKTNVWGVGTILWALISHKDGHQNLDFSHEGSREPQPFPGNVRLRYKSDSDLLDTVTQCMRYQPKDRLSFDELLQRATSQLAKDGGWNLTAFPGLEHMKAEDYTKWANGTAFEDLPQLPHPPIGRKLVPLAHPPKDATASVKDLIDLGGPTGARLEDPKQLKTRTAGEEHTTAAHTARPAGAARPAGRPRKRKSSDEAVDDRAPSKRHKIPLGEGGRHLRSPTAPTGPTPPAVDPPRAPPRPSYSPITPPAQDPTAVPAQAPVVAPAAVHAPAPVPAPAPGPAPVPLAAPAPPQGVVNCGGHAQNGQRCKRRLKPRADGRPPFCTAHEHQRP